MPLHWCAFHFYLPDRFFSVLSFSLTLPWIPILTPPWLTVLKNLSPAQKNQLLTPASGATIWEWLGILKNPLAGSLERPKGKGWAWVPAFQVTCLHFVLNFLLKNIYLSLWCMEFEGAFGCFLRHECTVREIKMKEVLFMRKKQEKKPPTCFWSTWTLLGFYACL